MEQQPQETQAGLMDVPGTGTKLVQRMNANADTLFTATKDLNPAQRASVFNYIVGWMCGVATEREWHEALAHARKAVIR